MTIATNETIIDTRILGARIQEARKARGLTQQQGAEAIGVSRPTYIALEKGERPVAPRDLIRLSELYGRTMNQLLRQQEPLKDFVAHFRSSAARAPADAEALDRAVSQLQELCEDYLYLEQITDSAMPRRDPAPYRVDGRDPVDAAEEVAEAERQRLGLGSRPIRDLPQVLGSEVGIRIFNLDLPSRVSGLFIFGEPAGACTAVQRKHPRGRRLWSLAHEYAHFLAHRFEAEVTVHWSSRRKPEKERFADAFARIFLMPRTALRRRFQELLTSTKSVTMATLLQMADEFDVSVQALVLRLEELRLIPARTWHHFEQRGFKVKEAQSSLGLGDPTAAETLPHRYVKLAVAAYQQELLSEGQLMRFLRTDRQQAREIVQRVISRSDVSEAGETGQLTLDMSWTLNSQ